MGGLYSVLQTFAVNPLIPSIAFNDFAIWGSLTITPFGFLIALLQAGSSSGSETIFGSLVSILNSFMIVCVGYVVTYVGQSLYIFNNAGISVPLIGDIFGGGIVFLLFWTIILAMSRFYDAHYVRATGLGSTNNLLYLSSSQHDTTLNNSAIDMADEDFVF